MTYRGNGVLAALLATLSFFRKWQRSRMMMKPLVAALAMTLFAAAAYAEPVPVQKPPGPGGSCPHGYMSSGSFCVPSAGAQDAIAKPANETCPWGWTSSGSYCLRSGSPRR
jgi:hypothetical protein